MSLHLSYHEGTRKVERHLLHPAMGFLSHWFAAFHPRENPGCRCRRLTFAQWLHMSCNGELEEPGTPYLFGVTKPRGNAYRQYKKREALLRDDTHRLASHRDCSIRLPQTAPPVTGVSELEEQAGQRDQDLAPA